MDNSSRPKPWLIIIFFVFLFAGIGFWIFRMVYTTTSTSAALPEPTLPFNHGYPAGDVNHDSKVDLSDQQLVQSSNGCNKNQICWSQVIGKTIDGENPIYASDLDLNQDGTVNQNDYNLVIIK